MSSPRPNQKPEQMNPSAGYVTDLGDTDWQQLRHWLSPEWDAAQQAAGIAPAVGDSEARQRRVVDTLLYREQTGLGWSLLPDDLAPGHLARECEARWRASGAWERVLEVGRRKGTDSGPGSSSFDFPPRTLLRGVKRCTCWLLRRLPLGERLLLPRLRDLATVLSTRAGAKLLPRVMRRGRRQGSRTGSWNASGEPAMLSECIALDPWDAQAHVIRGNRWLETGNHTAACRDGWRVLALPGCRPAVLALAHRLLAVSLAARGEIDRALVHAYQVLYVQRHDLADAGVLGGELPPSTAASEQLWIEAHDLLAEEVINRFGLFAVALELYRRKRRPQERFASRLGALQRTLYLPDDWVRNIGHMALLDFWVKMKRMGWRSWDEMVLVAPPERTANRSYLDYFRPHLSVITDPHRVERLRPLSQALGSRVAGILELPDGTAFYFCEGMGVVQEEWERQGHGPLIALSEADREHGWRTLRRLGVPEGSWFVGLHVRTPGYHNEGNHPCNAHRNADITTYGPAVEEIVRRGGWVVRLGDRSMPPLPATKGVIDYARSPERSPRLDVFLCGACRFYLGGASGLTHVPTTFGVPCVVTNWSSNALPVYSKQDVFLPKLLWSEAQGRFLSFEEMLCVPIRCLTYSGARLRENGLRAVDNSPEELRAVVLEMLDRLEGRAGNTDADQARQAEFQATARKHGLLGFPAIGRDFLRRHADLLPSGEPGASATGGRRAG